MQWFSDYGLWIWPFWEIVSNLQGSRGMVAKQGESEGQRHLLL